ncbi:GAF domain-like protein [Jimgerdemannia flammicorona]|uniref:GAF domain-like protein n=1 Tax=Jimgerdemannia flammicorona TaxID=994334 RepID=A0A433PPI5_9FUNG|nr:GAF domain-like protein [Jimgerdemannia flammicorona]
MHPTESDFDSNIPRPKFYAELVEQAKSLVEGQRNWVTNLSNISALVYHGLRSLERAKTKPVNWAGFYFADPKDPTTLILGPFQGKIACTVIPFGKGVCGAAAATKQTQLVRDVHAFPGHIACDSASNSEIVVPLVLPSGRVIGVLDIDNEAIEGFDEDDKVGLEALVTVIVEGSDWW